MTGDRGTTPTPPYMVVLSRAARRALTERLPETAAVAAWEFISGPVALRPHIVGRRLRAPFEGQLRAQRGAYRVIYRIDDESRVVFVIAVAHRRDAYRS